MAHTKQFRKWIGTYNNPTVDAREFIERWHTHGGAVYVNGQLEKGASGTPHIQYFVQYKDKKRLGTLKAHCPHSHFKGVGKDNGADSYAMKEDTRLEGPWEFGVRPAQRNVKGDVARRNEEIIKMGVINAVDQGIIRIEEMRKVKQAVDLYHQMKENMKPVDVLDNRWFYGKTGTGKSFKARQDAPNAFLKTNTKWWDGYAQQEDVLIEELGPNQISGHHLKQWADHYPFAAETKGGSIQLRPKRITITSNYTIREVYPEPQDYEPLERRFKVHHFNAPLGN